VTTGLERELGGLLPQVPCGPAGGASGLRSSKALVANVLVGGGQAVKVALDYSQDSVRQPDVVRFDFTGQGAFNDVQVAKIEWAPSNGRFGPATLTVERGGGKQAVAVWGSCYTRNERGRAATFLRVGFASGAEGPCQFGQRSCKVRIVDSSGNLSLRDGLKLPVTGEPYGAVVSQNADKVIVLSDDNKPIVRGYYGQPLQVDGQWYTVAVSDDEATVTAATLDAPTAELRPAPAKWGAILVGRKYVLELTGGTEPIRIPADAYALGSWAEFATGAGGHESQLLCPGDPRPVIKAEAGGMVPLPSATPLRCTMNVRQNGDTVVFSFEMKTASGLEVSAVMVPDERGQSTRTKPPRVKVFDASGKLIYQGDLQYG